jgi:hypothetical protein
MRLPARRITDRELEIETGIRPADHAFTTSDVRKRERQLLGPSWGKERRPFKPKGCK